MLVTEGMILADNVGSSNRLPDYPRCLENRPGVYRMIGKLLIRESAQLALSDLGCVNKVNVKTLVFSLLFFNRSRAGRLTRLYGQRRGWDSNSV